MILSDATVSYAGGASVGEVAITEQFSKAATVELREETKPFSVGIPCLYTIMGLMELLGFVVTALACFRFMEMPDEYDIALAESTVTYIEMFSLRLDPT